MVTERQPPIRFTTVSVYWTAVLEAMAAPVPIREYLCGPRFISNPFFLIVKLIRPGYILVMMKITTRKIPLFVSVFSIFLLVFLSAGCNNSGSDPAGGLNGTGPASEIIADHTVVHELWEGKIPESDIQAAKDVLRIGYGHTSHGSQITDGLAGLVDFADGGNLGTAYSAGLFAVSSDGAGDTLHLYEGDGYGDGPLDHDAGYYPDWVNETREFLDDPGNSGYNVIMWSWCGQVSGRTEQGMIDTYLDPMSQLEADYPDIAFIYMTGHLDGTGETGNLHLRNEQIRQYCKDRDKWLFDFADIESYDPDGNYYLDRGADDACNYDGGNWGTEWQNSHTEGADWYSCGSAHSQPLNSNMKAYAAWWLFVQVAASIGG